MNLSYMGLCLQYIVEIYCGDLLWRFFVKKYDPVMNKFLSFLANGMPQHPENLQQLTVSMRNTVQSLIVDVEIDLDAPLSDEDE
ncbi:hypothetical protein HGG82_09845 [Marinomonas sp. M1K-6]|uniref:Uncharacterized protein n=1 Tax=Marinomonas profundi TaxID=2726122 RepID=A0A847QYE0_9GAMM|nr:hypothetical protein [Marinomonas profundi]